MKSCSEVLQLRVMQWSHAVESYSGVLQSWSPAVESCNGESCSGVQSGVMQWSPAMESPAVES